MWIKTNVYLINYFSQHRWIGIHTPSMFPLHRLIINIKHHIEYYSEYDIDHGERGNIDRCRNFIRICILPVLCILYRAEQYERCYQ